MAIKKIASKTITPAKAKETVRRAQISVSRKESKAVRKYEKIRKERVTAPKWFEMKEEWVLGIVHKKPVSHASLAKKYNVALSSIQNRSSTDNWRAEAAKRAQLYDDEIHGRLQETREKAMVELQADLVANELEVRKRHAQMARGLQAKAIKRLSTLPIDALKPNEALKMLELGLNEERRALGLPDTFVKVQSEENDAIKTGYQTLTHQFEHHQRVKEMGLKLLAMIRAKGEPQIEEANVLEQAGLTALPDQGEAPRIEDSLDDALEEMDEGADEGEEDDE